MTDSASPIGTIIALKGQVWAESESGLRPLENGSPVYQGEKIVTGPESNAEIRFLDDTCLSQGADSALSLDHYAYNPADESAANLGFGLLQGAFRHVSGKIAATNPENVQLESPLAVIGIRGTTTVHSVDPESGAETHGVEHISEGHRVIIQDSFGEIRIVNDPLTVIDLSVDAPMGFIRPMTPEELEFFQSFAPGVLELMGESMTPEGLTDLLGGAPGESLTESGSDGEGQAGSDATGAGQEPAGEGAEGGAEASSETDMTEASAQTMAPEGTASGPVAGISTFEVVSYPDQTFGTADSSLFGSPLQLSGSSSGSGGSSGSDLLPPPSTASGGDSSPVGAASTYPQQESLLPPPQEPTGSGITYSDPTHWEYATSGGHPYYAWLPAGYTAVSGTDGDEMLAPGGTGPFALFGFGGNDRLEASSNHMFYGGAGNDTIVGSDGADTIHGGTGDDVIIVQGAGHANSDLIDGGTGTNILQIMAGSAAENVFASDAGFKNIASIELLNDASGVDLSAQSEAFLIESNVDRDVVILSGAGNDIIIGGLSYGNTIHGAGGNDSLAGGDEDDSLDGGLGDDTLVGGPGADSMVGGLGADRFQIFDPNDLGGDEIDGTLEQATFDRLALVAQAAGQTFDLTDAMSIQHIDRIDIVSDVAGTQLVLGSTIADTADTNGDGNPGDIRVQFRGEGASYLQPMLNNILIDGRDLTDSQSLHVEGENYNQNGFAGNDTIYGGAGADTLEGGAGNDSIEGGDGADILLGGSGTDTLLGGVGDDTIRGGAGVDSMSGGAGNDAFAFKTGDVAAGEIIDGGAGVDSIWMDESVDFRGAQIQGVEFVSIQASSTATFDADVHGATWSVLGDDAGTGNETFRVLLGSGGEEVDISGLIFANWSGSDLVSVQGGDGNDTILGADVKTFMDGGAGNDLLVTGSGNDTLLGGAGDDTLTGGLGADFMTGGLGADRFRIYAPAELIGDTIDGALEQGTHDRLALVALSTNQTFNLTVAASIQHIDRIDIVSDVAGTQLVLGAAIAATADANGDGTLGDIRVQFRNGIDLNSAAMTNGIRIDGSALTSSQSLWIEGEGYQDGSDWYAGFAGNDTIIGGAGSDTRLYGGAGNDSISGNGGNDYFSGGLGADTLIGGTGEDRFIYYHPDELNGDSVVGGNTVGESDRLVIWPGGDNMHFDLHLASLADVDRIDVYSDRVGTRIDLSQIMAQTSDFNGDGILGDVRVAFRDAYDDSVSKVHGMFIDASNLASNQRLYFNGNGFEQGGLVYSECQGNDTVYGGAGSDLIYGGAGDDTLLGGDGNDTLDGGAGDDSILGGDGDDEIWGSQGVDTIDGGGGNNTIDYYYSDSAVNVDLRLNTAQSGGWAAGDVLSDIHNLYGSWSGDDTLIGTEGNNSIGGSAGHDSIQGLGGNDWIEGGQGNDTIYGGDGADRIQGDGNTADPGDGNDLIYGGEGADTILGGAGNDIIIGGLGADSLTGGDGADIFLYQSDSDSPLGPGDVIVDFDPMVDKLKFDPSMLIGTFAYLGSDPSFDNTGNSQARLEGETLYVDVNGNGVADMQIELTGVDAAQLGSDDFIWT